MIETLGTLARQAGHEFPPIQQRGTSISDIVPGTEAYDSLTWGAPTYTGRNVNPSTAMTYTAVWACIKIYAEGAGSLPLLTYRNTSPDGLQRILATDDYRYRMLREQPNEEWTSMEWREFGAASLSSWGNWYNYLEWDGRMRLKAIWPMRPDWMVVLRNPRTLKREYHYRPLYPIVSRIPAGVYEPFQIAHMRGQGNELVGYSPITLFRNAIALGQSYEEQGGRFVAGGGTQKVALVASGSVKDPQQIREEWMKRNSGLARSGDVAILHGGLDVKTFGIPPKDAQFLEGRSFQLAEVARIYGVPLGLLEDTIAKPETYASAEQADLRFVKWRMRPFCTRIEQTINVSILGNNDALTCQHDLDDLLRGDLLSQMNAWKAGVTGSIVEPNEARRKMNLPPSAQEGADDLWAQAQMVKLGTEAKPTQTIPAHLLPTPEPQQ